MRKFVYNMTLDDLFTHTDIHTEDAINNTVDYEHSLSFTVCFHYEKYLIKTDDLIKKSNRCKNLIYEKIQYILDFCSCVTDYCIDVQLRSYNPWEENLMCVIDSRIYFNWIFDKMTNVFEFMSGLYSILYSGESRLKHQIQYINLQMHDIEKHHLFYHYYDTDNFIEAVNGLTYYLNRHTKYKLKFSKATYTKAYSVIRQFENGCKMLSPDKLKDNDLKKLYPIIIQLGGKGVQYWID